MLQNLSEEIRECLRRAEECKRLSKTALSTSAIEEYLEMEHRWLTLARSYEFSERLSRFTEPYTRKARNHKETPGV
jgi:chromosome segregation ATPase